MREVARITIEAAPISLNIEAAKEYVGQFVAEGIEVRIAAVETRSWLTVNGEPNAFGVDIAAELWL